MASRAPLLASFALLTGCLGPNPYLDDDDVADTSESSDGSGDTSTTFDSEDTETTETTADNTTGDPSCMNDMQDGNETATDCGGDCDPCGDGSTCLLPEDCVSGVCDETCQTPACDDEVLNGDELAADCGGPCGFCESSTFITAWDDVEDGNSQYPTVAISDVGDVAIAFDGAGEARLRWFEQNGAPQAGGSAIVGESLTFFGDLPIPIVLRVDEPEPAVIAAVAGTDAMSTSTDLFMVGHTLADGENDTRVIYQGTSQVLQGAVASVSTHAVFAWKQDKQIYLRRRDFSIANDEWIDLMPLAAETMTAQYDGDLPDLAIDPDGTVILVWSRCVKAGTPCSIAMRRFDGDWIEPDPVIVSDTDVYMTAPHVAVDATGRIGLSWSLLDLGDSWAYARILDADLVPEGDAWVLQSGFPQLVGTDVAALDDGSFAYVWADVAQNRVHLRRFVGNDVPKLMNVGDEAPWPTTDEPASPALANANHRLAVVWSALDGSFTQIHGQVLTY